MMGRISSSLISATMCSFAVVVGAFLSCASPSEGEHCNIDLSHDECASNLACVVPTNCTYAVCCPPEGRPSSHAGCNPCGREDAGEIATPDDAAAGETPDASPSDTSDAADAAEGG